MSHGEQFFHAISASDKIHRFKSINTRKKLSCKLQLVNYKLSNVHAKKTPPERKHLLSRISTANKLDFVTLSFDALINEDSRFPISASVEV